MRRTARAFTIVATLVATAACNRNGLNLAVSNHPTDPALLMSCARSVASDRGLPVISQSDGTLQAKSVVATPGDESVAPSYDVLTVKLSPAKRGLSMLVGSASFALRQLRGGGVGTAAAKTEWVGTAPSTRVALARDAVLAQCGSLGS
jgi:hypothetical protein